MKTNTRSKSVFFLAISTLVLSGTVFGFNANAANGNASPTGQRNGIGVEHQAVCGTPAPDSVRCHSRFIVDIDRVSPWITTDPAGLTPAKVKTAYGFSTSMTAGSGTTIAIVDAYDDPTAEADLATFSSEFGLPACTTANGCFTKVNQTGGSTLPKANAGWALEISLDVQWAHAIAPGADILLVEAKSARYTDLLAAVDYASANADYVSNSWGSSEFANETNYDTYFDTSGVSYFFSSGDAGLPAEYPSSSPNVISVGGTTLNVDSSGNFISESGWKYGGGGCSTYETKTSAQSPFSTSLCGTSRATPDVSLVADPATGVSVYDSTKYRGRSGWFIVGGTSASAPMWAGRSAASGALVNSAFVYGGSITYRDITTGGNEAGCLTGFDLCSGRGSWTGSTP